jgi:serine/threonine protein kinase
MPLAQISDIGKQACGVLDATHSAGITHRDLKPDNIFIIPDSELGERVKILDFGIAKLSGGTAAGKPQTVGTMGTPAYMAPEQWRSARDADVRSDVWSLGVVLYELLSGKRPFQGESVTEMCAAVLAEDSPPLAIGVPELDPFAPREAGTYLGLHAGLIGKEAPQWPDGDGPRIFAYLRSDYRHIEATLAALAASGARCVVFVHGAMPALREKYQAGRLVFSAGLLDMDRAVTESDLCICHGNFGTVMEVLRRGKPMVVLPVDLEKFLTATAVERQNVGCCVHPDPENPDFSGAIHRALTDSSFKGSARVFAERHREPAIDTIVQGAADRIEALAQAGSRGG